MVSERMENNYRCDVTAHKNWTDRQTRIKRLEYKGLWKIDHKICNNKGIQITVYRIREKILRRTS
jgi:hypothetical protein